MSTFESNKSNQLDVSGADSNQTSAPSTIGASSGLAAMPDSSSGSLGGAPSAASTGGGDGGGSGNGLAGDGKTPLTEEEERAVMNEQPTGDGPSAEEMDDRKDAQSSADNLLPTEKLENGLKHVRLLLLFS